MKVPQIEACLNKTTGVLDLSMSNLKSIQFLQKLTHSKFIHRITTLDLSDNQLLSLPDELDFFPAALLKSVHTVILSKNKLTKFPKSLTQFSNLKKLDLYGNNITNLSVDHFSNYKKLSWLDISGNPLAEEWVKLVENKNHTEAAMAVKEYCNERAAKQAKLRAKKEKQAAKKAEKERLEKKAADKEKRRQAWEQKQKEAGDAEVITQKKLDENYVQNPEVEEDSESSEESDDDVSDQTEKPRGGILSIFMMPFTLIWFVITWIFSGIFSIAKFAFYVAVGLVATVACFYLLCHFLPSDPNHPDYQYMACPVLLSSIHDFLQ